MLMKDARNWTDRKRCPHEMPYAVSFFHWENDYLKILASTHAAPQISEYSFDISWTQCHGNLRNLAVWTNCNKTLVTELRTCENTHYYCPSEALFSAWGPFLVNGPDNHVQYEHVYTQVTAISKKVGIVNSRYWSRKELWVQSYWVATRQRRLLSTVCPWHNDEPALYILLIQC